MDLRNGVLLAAAILLTEALPVRIVTGQTARNAAGASYDAVARDPNAAKGQTISWLGSSEGSTETKTADGKVESSVTRCMSSSLRLAQ